MNRSDQVRALLLTMDDHLPDPAGPRVYEGAEPGVQASKYVRCDTCSGCGRTVGPEQSCVICLSAARNGKPIKRPGHGCKMCPICDGHGTRRRRAGDPSWDAYSGKTLEELDREPMSSETEGSHKSVRAILSPSDPVTRDYAWVREREVAERLGSYQELRTQLEWLRDKHIGRYEMLMHWASSHDDRQWSWSLEAIAGIEETINELAGRMPVRIKVPARARRMVA